MGRSGEMRITRFLHNAAVTVTEMMGTAFARTAGRVAGRHVLALQDTTSVRAGGSGASVALHAVLAVDAGNGAVLGAVDAAFFVRTAGKRANRKSLPQSQKESQRWLDGAHGAARLRHAGAACVTVVCDREGDFYEDFAVLPAGVEALIRAGQDRKLSDGRLLFEVADSLPELGRMTVALAAAPGRPARTAILALRSTTIEIGRPVRSKMQLDVHAQVHGAPLAACVSLTLVEAREIDPPTGTAPAHWRLLTTHKVGDAADARQITDWYRQRWTIEQLFRTLKTQGFQIEALRQAENGPLEKLVAGCLIAAVIILQLVHERDGAAKRPLEDSFDPGDQLVIETICKTLEGKTEKQKNPHPCGTLAYAAWVMARLGGWTGYYGKPGPIVMLQGLNQFHAIKKGWKIRNV